jgi:hypothetical protein
VDIPRVTKVQLRDLVNENPKEEAVERVYLCILPEVAKISQKILLQKMQSKK